MQYINQLNWENRLIYRFEIQKKDILIVTSALFFSFSYPTSPFSFFIYFAFIPLIRRLEFSGSHREAFKVGFIVGLIVNSLVFYWIVYYKFNSYLLIIILNPIQFAIFSYLYSHLKIFTSKTRLIIFPFLWTFLEFIREFGDLALNWLNIGYTQGNFLNLIQFTDITGLNGVVFWICITNVIIYNLIYKVFRLKYVLINYIILALLFVLPVLYGHYQISEKKNKIGILASYVQPNVKSIYKWNNSNLKENINILIEESEKLEVEPYSLIIWPETALPIALQEFGNKANITQFLKDRNTHILTGILYDSSISDLRYRYNSSVLFSYNNKKNSVYNKIKLVPVEEVLPFIQLYSFVIPYKYLQHFYNKGEVKTVFNANLRICKTEFINQNWISTEKSEVTTAIKFSTIICFESSFPSFVRDFILSGAEFIVVQTNDEWFGYSTQSVQHLITSRFRSIENRTSIVHCSNAGISSFIDSYGRYYGKSDLLIKSSDTQIIPLRDEISFFSIYGDWIGKLSTAFILITFIVIFYRKHKHKIR